METVTLRDGSRLLIRPIEPDDREALAEGHRRLSPESQYRRFFGPKPELHERDLDYLTQVDHHDHEALVALDSVTLEGVGVARYVRTGPGVAEPAIVVADDWQGRGVARLLLDALADRAREEGIRRFDAPVLASNTEAIRVMERLGRTTVRPQGREVELRVDLPAGPGAGPRLAMLLSQFAAGTLAPARTLLERLWPRTRRGEPDAPRRNLIIVGTDGSAHAQAAVEAASALAAASGATVHVVGAHRFLLPDLSEVTAAVEDAAADLRERGLEAYEEVRRGDPALVLTDVAAEENARLVVVGSGERSKAARRLLGSVTDFVAERSPCDVLIVRPRDGG
jgi:nucleotide-binding universal stress UspA family protein